MEKARDQRVLDIYEAWRHAWLAVDTDAMKRLFDADHPGFTYQSEEASSALHTYDELDRYWTQGAEVVLKVAEWTDLARSVVLEGDLAIIYARLRASLLLKGRSEPLDGEIRVSMIMQERDAEWKIFHYHESRKLNLGAL